MNINSVTFKANYVTQWQVLVKPTNKNDKPEYISASFVELDPENKNDLDTMYNLNLHWGFLETYAYQILDSMERIHKNLMRYNENSKFYALTLQHDKFEKLEPKKILAVTELTEDKDKNSISINYLQVDPNNVRNAIQAKYKHVGTTIIDTIKDLYKKNIKVQSTKSAKPFYEAIGFKLKKPNSSNFIFIQSKKI